MSKKQNKHRLPLPLFDTLENLAEQVLPASITLPFAKSDFNLAKNFLTLYKNNTTTFNAYRRDIYPSCFEMRNNCKDHSKGNKVTLEINIKQITFYCSINDNGVGLLQTLDFKHVQTIGQGFVDQFFRIYRRENPNIEIYTINANSDVEFMLKRRLNN